MTKAVKIKDNQWYTLQDIVKGQFFIWTTHTTWSVRKVVASDQKQKNILKPVITGKGTNTKYRFKGENIIKFVTAVETGKVRL